MTPSPLRRKFFQEPVVRTAAALRRKAGKWGRSGVRTLAALGALGAGASQAVALTATPSTTEGPYYTFSSQNLVVQKSSSYYDAHFYTTEGTDNDLTHINSSSTQCSGTLFLLSGTLVNTSGVAISGATIELWEADNNGIYWFVSSSSGTNNYAGRDKNFQGYGKATTDSNGAWSFRTIKPGLYTGRIRHFHFKVDINGSTVLTSQFMFNEDSASFSSDNVAAPLVKAGTMSYVTLTPTSGTDSSGNTALLASKQIVVSYTGSTGGTSSAPTITTQPTSVSVEAGASASFTVAASGSGTLSYQWYKDGAAISGATAAAYTIGAVSSASAGSYYATASNSAGSVTSSTATLTVAASAVPTVNVKAQGDATIQAGVENGKLVFTRLGGDTAAGLTIFFKVKGSAVNGTDYTELDGSALDTSLTFPAGTVKLKVKLTGVADGQSSGIKTVIVKLTASPTGSYVVGDSPNAKLFLVDSE